MDQTNNKNIDRKILDEVIGFIKQANYGEVVITIHDSKIVQVEKREKKRFEVRQRLHEQS